MSQWPLRRLCCAIATFAIVTPLLVGHDGDGKLLDRQPPYPGPGWLPGNGPEGPGFDASGISLHAWLSLNDIATAAGLPTNFPSDNGNSCWGYVSPSGREYAIMGIRRGTTFFEITNPQAPVFAGFIDGPDSLWRDMKTYQNYCYVISEGGSGIQVISLANIDGPSNRVSLVTEVTTGGTLATHTLAVNEASGRLYRCGGGSNGIRIYSLANPAAPAYLSSWTDRYVHECQVLSYSTGPYAGKEIAFLCSENPNYTEPGLDIIDVTDPQNMVSLYPPRVVWDLAGFSHQIWLSPDRNYAYVNDEFDETDQGFGARTIIIDVRFLVDSSFTAPAVAGYFFNGNPSIDHNLYVKGNLIYASNYRSGLRIFCAQNPTNLAEIAYFDTYPDNDNPSYNGLWNNYSFFPSGTVIGSDIERGMFVWDVSGATQTSAANAVTFSYPQGRPAMIAPAGGTTMQVTLRTTGCGTASVLPNSGLLHVNDGGGWVTSPLASIGGELYQATFPPTTCGATVSFYVSAANDLNVTYNNPAGAPATVYSATSANGVVTTFSDNFETDTGWTTEILGATAGQWQRGVPINDPNWDYDPAADADGSGQCWLTENLNNPSYPEPFNTDVDNGSVRLTSPVFDMSAPGLRIEYDYYLNLTNTSGDRLRVEVSGNGGGTWIIVVDHNTNGGLAWRHHTIAGNVLTGLGIPLTSNMRIRFTATDGNPQSIVEAGVDGFKVTGLDCSVTCTKADVNNDGAVNGLDIDAFTEVMISGGTPGSVAYCATDVNNNGQLEPGADVTGFVSCVLNAGCP